MRTYKSICVFQLVWRYFVDCIQMLMRTKWIEEETEGRSTRFSGLCHIVVCTKRFYIEFGFYLPVIFIVKSNPIKQSRWWITSEDHNNNKNIDGIELGQLFWICDIAECANRYQSKVHLYFVYWTHENQK